MKAAHQRSSTEAGPAPAGSARGRIARAPAAPPELARCALAPAELRRRLGRWFAGTRRDLPWRRGRDAYRTWISEAMLQQTRVETVVPYFERFVRRFPDVRALARAEPQTVLEAWSGLGYYRRARDLHAAAVAVTQDHGGRFPRERAQLLALPGVGPYSAGAIASLAFGRPEPLVDGNVQRVFARLFALEERRGSAALARRAWALAAALVPRRGAGRWNEALMELGATVCLPREPACGRCPLRAGCAALAQGRARDLPLPRPPAATQAVELLVLLVERRGRVLLQRRPGTGRMALMWELPVIELGGAARLHPPAWPRAADGGPLFERREPLGDLRHAITCHRISARIHSGVLLAPARPPLAWAGPEQLARVALTGLSRKALRLRARAG